MKILAIPSPPEAAQKVLDLQERVSRNHRFGEDEALEHNLRRLREARREERAAILAALPTGQLLFYFFDVPPQALV